MTEPSQQSGGRLTKRCY